MNLIEGEMGGEGGRVFRAHDGGLTIDLSSAPVPEACIGQPVTLGIRPENIRVAGSFATGARQAEATLLLEIVESMGNETFVYARSGAQSIVARMSPEALPALGEPIRLVFDLDKLPVLDSPRGARIRSPPKRAGDVYWRRGKLGSRSRTRVKGPSMRSSSSATMTRSSRLPT